MTIIKAIVFDFGGVISPGVIVGEMKKLDKKDPRYLLFQEESYKWDMGEMTVGEFYQALGKIMNVPLEKVEEEFYGKAVSNTDVVKLIKKLKKRYKIILFSDNFAYNLHKLLDILSLRDLFDQIIVSSDHKMIKINPVFFQKMLDLISFTKNEVLFVDDTQKLVDIGNSLGIKSLLFTNAQKLQQDLQKEGITL